MAKRLTDTEKYKKQFHRGLQGPYKLLWDYLYHSCDHAGIWIVDFEIAQIYLGHDMQVDPERALELFNTGEERIIVLNSGSKWFIVPFIDFQYGSLNPSNRVHMSVLKALFPYKNHEKIKALLSPFLGAMQGSKDKDKDKEKDNDKGGVGGKTKLFPLAGKICYRSGCKLPAVYKSAGEYDTYYCAEHMPEQVKEKYTG